MTARATKDVASSLTRAFRSTRVYRHEDATTIDVLFVIFSVPSLDLVVPEHSSDGAAGRIFEVGGPEVLTYRQMMDQYAEIAALPKRRVVRVPFLTPRLSAHWVGVVTPLPRSLARPDSPEPRPVWVPFGFCGSNAS